jgi:imidazolonepropionase-like amidohydrolase
VTVSRRALTGALLFDGTDEAPSKHQTVVWEGERITWVGPDGAADLAGAEVSEARGDAVLPGLIDGHVHLVLDGTIEGIDGVASEPTNVVLDRALRGARTLLGAGITTARDQGSTHSLAIEVARRQRAGSITGARILAAGRGLTPTGGHGWMIGVQADGPDQVRAAVAEEIRRGADVIKLFPTGGVLGSGAHGFDVVMSVEELEAAVDEAHRNGKLIGAHVHGQTGIDMCLDAGVDTIEHATGIRRDQARRARDQGVALVPTLVGIDAMMSSGATLPDDLLARVRQVMTLAMDGIAGAIGEGAIVLTGTDAGTPFNPPGGLVREMEILAGLGLGTLGVIAAATSQAADVFRLGDLGRIRPGAVADMIVVPGNPMEDLRTLASPRLVLQAGSVV